jgi:hypothetical protein
MYASYTNVALTDYALTDSGDHTTYNVPTADFATKRVWDKTATWTIQTSIDGSTWIAAVAGYTIRYLTGQVTLAGPIGGTHQCRVHAGAYLPLTTAANARNWEFTPAADKYDSTVFTGSGPVWKTYVPGLLGGSIKLDQWWADGSWLTMLTQATGTDSLVAELFTGRNSYERYACYARITGDDIKVAVNALIDEPLTLEVDGSAIYFAGQFA